MSQYTVNLHLTPEMHQCLFIICVIVFNLYYCYYAKTSSQAVQIRHSKVNGNPIALSLYSILLGIQEDKRRIGQTFVHVLCLYRPLYVLSHVCVSYMCPVSSLSDLSLIRKNVLLCRYPKGVYIERQKRVIFKPINIPLKFQSPWSII